MAAPTLFRRLVVAQTIGSLALVLVFFGAFYAERNRTVARLTGERWAPALRAAAGLAGAAPRSPTAVDVRVSDVRPADAISSSRWAPRIATLRATLREAGVPAGDVVFTHGTPHALTWIAVTGPDGRTRWLGLQDDIIESDVFRRLAVALLLGLAVVGSASWILARRLTRPLESLRRRIESHELQTASAGAAPAPDGDQPTLEIAAIEAAWIALADRLARQERERALLLAGVSHDLRSPLSRIRMAAELLPDEVNVSARRASIVRNVDVADRLIASFLDYVRASELPLSATVDIAAVARQLLATRDDPSGALALHAPARLDVAHTHELLLERLLANLVDNAMRHGRPPVTIRLSTAGDDVLLDVDDDGPGLPPDAQSRLTQAFARGDASRGTPGTGLGLAIVQQIVRRMQGDLSFERVDGTARVRVRLPAPGGPADQRPPA